MHIIIGFLTTLAGLIWALHALQKAGVDINAFNPFTWYRRRQWAKKLGGKALYNLGKPMEVAAVLLIGMAKLEGEISREQKKDILHMFQEEFHLSSQQAMELFVSSSYLLQEEDHLLINLPKILEKSASQFTQELSSSLIVLLKRVGNLDGELSHGQNNLLLAIAEYFKEDAQGDCKWQ